MSKHILSTRPLDDALVKEAGEKDLIIEVIPFIETKPVLSEAIAGKIQEYAATEAVVVFTSVNAVHAVVHHLANTPHWQIYCIGGTTKDAVIKYFGSQSILAYAKNATLLLDFILSGDKHTQVIFFCGDRRLDTIPATLKQHNMEVHELIVYHTLETPVKISKVYDGILFFSPSAVDSFFSVNEGNPKNTMFAIGKTTAIAIQKYCNNEVVISGEPSSGKLVEQAVDFFFNNA